jgi:hypothetical protein
MDVLSKERPNAIELLGKNLVVWYNEGTWTCFEDLCPHRLAPLSGGLALAAASWPAGMHAMWHAPYDMLCLLQRAEWSTARCSAHT